MHASRVIRGVGAVAVLGVAAGCALLQGDALDEPTLSEPAARQAATSFATALDDLGALFLVGDPATERLQVLHWEDDPASATQRIADQLTVFATASAFIRASADELQRRGADGTVISVETRVTDAVPLGADSLGVDWVRVDIAQDETHEDGVVTSAATSYGIGVRDGAVVDVRDVHGVLSGDENSSAAAVTRAFVGAVALGDERLVARHVDEDHVTEQEIAALRAWLAAAGRYDVTELPAAQLGSVQVAYLVPEHGPLVRFDLARGAGTRGAALLTWELIGSS